MSGKISGKDDSSVIKVTKIHNLLQDYISSNNARSK